MRQAVIVGSARSPIGSFGGGLREVSAAELGGLVLREVQGRAKIEASQVDEVIMGCIGQVAEDAYIARRCAVNAGLPFTVPALSVNRLCSLDCRPSSQPPRRSNPARPRSFWPGEQRI